MTIEDLAELVRGLATEVRGLRAEVRAVLLDREAWVTACIVLQGGVDAFGHKGFTSAELLAYASVDIATRRLLRAALPDTSKAVGKLLASLVDTAVGDLRLTSEDSRLGYVWTVKRVCSDQTRSCATWPPSGTGAA